MKSRIPLQREAKTVVSLFEDIDIGITGINRIVVSIERVSEDEIALSAESPIRCFVEVSEDA